MNTYSYPVNRPNIYSPNPPPNQYLQPPMPYYGQSQPPVYYHRSTSQHQPQVYTTTTRRSGSRPRAHDYAYAPHAGYSTHASPAAHTTVIHTNGHHRRSHSMGPSNSTYLSPAAAYRDLRRSPGHSSSGQRDGHGHSSTPRHRSSSVSRQRAPVVPDTRGQRRSSSHTRNYAAENLTRYPSNTSHRRRGSEGQSGFGDRLRRMFGISSERQPEYVDARTGRPVDWHGRPMYRS